MGDEKYYTVQLKGVAYRFAPLDPEDVKKLITALHLNVSGAKMVKALTKILSESAGDEQWDAITDRYLSDELQLDEFTVGLFERLIKRQDKDGALTPVDAE
jgi:hypothetical protein